MLYALEQGEKEQEIIKQCMRERLPLPKRIQNAPELILGLELYYSAYIDLDSSRSMGMEPGRIPWSEIRKYAKEHELTEEQTEDLTYHIRSMDKAYMKFIRSKR